ncbi:MAG: Na+/H+ antiporter [Candidatus Eremiobacteraeota bacterium]|nr:Na+/H+ antiporter [Candidatus Eremiobacteraeota bacterium]
MTQALVLITFLVAVVVLSVLAKRFHVPYPIAFVIGGIGLAFSKNLPHPHVEPDLILLVVVPPLLFSAAWTTDWVALRRNARPVSLLAIGLVLVTTGAVAVFVHSLVGFGWALAFTLGAIVSPPDAVAAEAIFEHLAVPRRVATIISGECLFNDATALVVYRFALAAAVSGAFSLARASVAFVLVVAGGILVGIVAAFALEAVLRYIRAREFDDPLITSVIFLLAPFVSYLPAEELHLSGVLAAVTAGIVMSRRAVHFIDSEARVIASSVWRLLTFILNAFAFLLIGLELPLIVAELVPHVRSYVLYGFGLALLVIVVRILWVFPATYLPRVFSARLRRRDPSPPWQWVAVLGWSGMRGIISLAAALALPYSLGEQAFPERGVAIFFTFCVIFATLVVQGATLGPLIEWLGVTETSKGQKLESALRVRALEAGVRRLHEIVARDKNDADTDIASRILEEYDQRIDVLNGKVPEEEAKELPAEVDRRLQKEALDAERRSIVAMRGAGEIPDDIYRSIEYDLDLAALRLS